MYLSDSGLGYFALGQLQPPQLTLPPQPRPSLLQPGPQLRLPPYETIVGYARDRSSLTSAQLDRVRRVADFIASTWPGNGAITSVRVTGYIHTDEWLSGLGEQRALAVRAAMLAALNQARPGLSANIRWITEDRGLGSVPKVEIYLWAGPTAPPIPPLVRVPSPAEVAHRAVPLGPGAPTATPTTAPTVAPSTTSVRPLPPNPLDARALAIIAAANAPTPGIYGRAVSTVWSILRTYYPSEATKVSSVVYSESVPGLVTTRMGTGPSATGAIQVGRYFIEHVNAHSFARRLLQVGHELRHIDQYRAGMIGHDRQPEREFLAHCWAVFAGERRGTGRMSHSMRVAIIDAALGNLNCLSAQVRGRYRKHEERLRAMRATEQTASGRAATLPPAACVRSP